MGDSEVVLTGGAENMSITPHTVRGIRFGVRLGQEIQVDFLGFNIFDHAMT